MRVRAISAHTGLFLLAVFLSVFMAPISTLSVEINPPTPSVGDRVILNVVNYNDELRFAEWYQGNETNATKQIIRYNRDGSTNKGDKFFPEAQIQSNGSLVIVNLKKEFESNYTVVLQGNRAPEQYTVFLKIKEPGLSAGAIAGICIAVFAVFAAVVGGLVYRFKYQDSGLL